MAYPFGEQFTTFDEVKQITNEQYFNGNKFSIDGFIKKYQRHENQTYVELMWEICQYMAQAEPTQELADYWAKRWFHEIYHDWWQPAGSEVSGANTDSKISMANCTTINMGANDAINNWDNLESIYRNTAYKVAKTAAYRQGLGVDFSAVRPRGAEVKNSSRESNGAIHWMKFIDSIGYYVGQKGRIPAMLFSISCFTENVQIYTSIGWLYVNEITENFEYYKDNIQIWTENGYRNLTGVNTKDNQVVYEIEVENGKTIEVTEDHEFEVLNSNTDEQYVKQIKDIDSENEELILFS
jgi:hypothetical protein